MDSRLNNWGRSWDHNLRSSMCHRRWSRMGSFRCRNRFRRCNRCRIFFFRLYFGRDLGWRGFGFDDGLCLGCMDIGLSLVVLSVWFRTNRRRGRSNMNRHDWRRSWRSSRYHLGRASARGGRRFTILGRELGVSGSWSSRQRLLYKQLSWIDKLVLQLFLLDLGRTRRRGSWRLRLRGRL